MYKKFVKINTYINNERKRYEMSGFFAILIQLSEIITN